METTKTIAEAIRVEAVRLQKAYATGERGSAVDIDDLVGLLETVANAIDPRQWELLQTPSAGWEQLGDATVVAMSDNRAELEAIARRLYAMHGCDGVADSSAAEWLYDDGDFGLVTPYGALVVLTRRPSRVKLSEMAVGDLAFYLGDLVQLRDGGLSGGADHDLYLALAGRPGDDDWTAAAAQGYPELVSIDSDDVAGVEQ